MVTGLEPSVNIKEEKTVSIKPQDESTACRIMSKIHQYISLKTNVSGNGDVTHLSANLYPDKHYSHHIDETETVEETH